MTRTFQTMTAAALTAIAIAPAPAFADQDRRGPRAEGSRGSRGEEHSEGRAVPRYEVRRDRDYRDGGPVVVAPRVVRPYVVRPYVVRPYYRPSYVRPYYVRPNIFHPRFRLGIGLFVGYPVPYAYAYPYPVPVYGYAAPAAPVYVGPSSTLYGGVSLEMNPGDANVYVDGTYAGIVRDFDGTGQTLTLTAGRHRIEIDAYGYEPIAFDVDVVPGQIVPYRGDLQPARY